VADLGHTRKPLTIIGLGNEFLSDDGVGIHVVRELKKRLAHTDVVVEELSLGGLQLLDYLAGFEKCVIIDAIVTGAHAPGTLSRFVQTADHEPVMLASSHQIDLGKVLALAALMGADLPQRLIVYGIEAEDITTFGETCSNEVSRAIPRIVDAITRDLDSRSLLTACGEWQIVRDPFVAQSSMEYQ
jgi:hydrogenase maturation protease